MMWNHGHSILTINCSQDTTGLAAVVRTRPDADSNFEVVQLLLTAFMYSDINWAMGLLLISVGNGCEMQQEG